MAYLQTPVQRGRGQRGKSRLASRSKKAGPPPMPPLPDGGRYLLDYLLEVGPATGTGMGAVPVSYQELQAWQEQTGLALWPWEVQTLRRLSREYVSETHAAASPAAKAPWVPDEETNRQAVDAGFRALLDGLIAKQEAKAAALANRKARRRRLREGQEQ